MSGRPARATLAWPAALAALTGVVLGARLLTLAPGPEDMDSFLFARALDRYSVAEMRPHFPGYPVYVWAGRLARALTGDPFSALHLVSIVSSALAVVPLALLAAAWRREAGGTGGEARASGVAAALFWSAFPLSWITGTEIYADTLGLLFGLLVLLFVWEAGRRAAPLDAAAGITGGLMLGARLGDFMLLAPLAERLSAGSAPDHPGRVRAVVGGLAAGILPWLAWQWAVDGPALLTLGRSQMRGHFVTWGNTGLMDPDLLTRPTRFLGTQLVFGLGGGFASAVRAAVTVCLVVLLVVGGRRLWRARRPRALLLLWTIPYLVQVMVGVDIGYLRYGLPLVAIVAVVAAIGLPPGRAGVGVASITMAALLFVTVPLAREHHRRPPTELQLARFGAGLDPGRSALLTAGLSQRAINFVGHVAPGLTLVSADPATLRSKAASLEVQGRIVYSGEPAPDRPDEWAPVARFCRSGELDPLSAAEIWLFRYQPGGASAPAPSCAIP